jgi:hypothetical protein
MVYLFKPAAKSREMYKCDRPTLSGFLSPRRAGGNLALRLHDPNLARRSGGSAFSPVTASHRNETNDTLYQEGRAPRWLGHRSERRARVPAEILHSFHAAWVSGYTQCIHRRPHWIGEEPGIKVSEFVPERRRFLP